MKRAHLERAAGQQVAVQQAAWWGAALSAACILTACDEAPAPPVSYPAQGSEQRPVASAGAASSGSAEVLAADASAAPSPSGLVASEAPACRVMSASKVTALGQPVAAGELLDGDAWLTLEPGGELRVRHTRSARELGVSGPGLVRPCPEGLEGAWLNRGVLTAAAGAGARPGAMVWVSTPHGLVEWGEAQLVVEVAAGHTQAKLQTGAIAVRAAAGSSLTQPKGATQARLSARGTVKLQGSPSLEALTAACEAAAAATEEAARALFSGPTADPARPATSPPGGAKPAPSGAAPPSGAQKSGLGGLARAHAEARSAAREACASAGAALAGESQATPSEVASRLAKADVRWRQIPRRAGSQPAGEAKAAE